jgi:hypothetical protein
VLQNSFSKEFLRGAQRLLFDLHTLSLPKIATELVFYIFFARSARIFWFSHSKLSRNCYKNSFLEMLRGAQRFLWIFTLQIFQKLLQNSLPGDIARSANFTFDFHTQKGSKMLQNSWFLDKLGASRRPPQVGAPCLGIDRIALKPALLNYILRGAQENFGILANKLCFSTVFAIVNPIISSA